MARSLLGPIILTTRPRSFQRVSLAWVICLSRPRSLLDLHDSPSQIPPSLVHKVTKHDLARWKVALETHIQRLAEECLPESRVSLDTFHHQFLEFPREGHHSSCDGLPALRFQYAGSHRFTFEKLPRLAASVRSGVLPRVPILSWSENLIQDNPKWWDLGLRMPFENVRDHLWSVVIWTPAFNKA